MFSRCTNRSDLAILIQKLVDSLVRFAMLHFCYRFRLLCGPLVILKCEREAYIFFSGYCEEGVLPLQNALYRAAVAYYNQNSTVPDFEFQRFAYPPYTKDQYLPALILFVSIFIIIMYTYSSVSTIKMVAVEKETQMKVSYGQPIIELSIVRPISYIRKQI